MEFRDSPSDARFRAEVRQFLAESQPPREDRDGENEGEISRWRARLAERGWIAPAWPREYGGAGMTLMQQFIFNEELALARAPRPDLISVSIVGPTLIVHGSEAQKRQHLPAILRGEVRWCQAYSEPEAGSDLASLRTTARRDGDDYVINGQKVWVSEAHRAQWMITLARTDPEAPKHRGITYFLVPMDSPGLVVKPLVNMLGERHFNQVFFEDVRVPRENVVGEENRGWYVATTTLDFERSGIGTSVSLRLMAEDLIERARREPFLRDRLRAYPHLRLGLAEMLVEVTVVRMLSYRVISIQARGEIPNREASIAKLLLSEVRQRITRREINLYGCYGALLQPASKGQANPRGAARNYLAAVSATIAGGTSEIQRNIIAQRGLGLPR